MHPSGDLSFDFDLFAPLCHLFENCGLASNVNRVLPFIGSQVLLVGAGSGVVAKCLELKGRNVYGIDRSRRMCHEALVRRGFRWECVDAAAFVPTRRFDSVIISTGVIRPANAALFLPTLRRIAESALSEHGICVCALFAETEFDRMLNLLGFTSKELLHRLHSSQFNYDDIWPNQLIDSTIRHRLERFLELLKILYEHAKIEGVEDPLGSLCSDREYFRADEIGTFCTALAAHFGCTPTIQSLDGEIVAVMIRPRGVSLCS